MTDTGPIRARLERHKQELLLRAAELRAAYESAWEEWSTDDGEGAIWESTVGDGLTEGVPS